MNEEMIVRYCAPTLASLKTGNMFSCRFESIDGMREAVRGINRRLSGKGLRAIPLRYDGEKALIYIYRPCMLRRDLCDEAACSLLREQGYACNNPNRCLIRLREKMRVSGDFPHEIGLFLGYPPEDVHGFIHCKGEAKCTGCWKVYGDVDSACRTFERYRKCTDVYLRQWARGRDIEKLTVPA